MSPKVFSVAERQLATSYRSGSLKAASVQSSANKKSLTRASSILVFAFRRLRSKKRPSYVQRIVMPLSVLERAVITMVANIRLKTCLKPLDTGKGSDTRPVFTMRAMIPSWNDQMICANFGGQPSLDCMAHRPS